MLLLDGRKRCLSAFFEAFSFEMESARSVSNWGRVKWLLLNNALDNESLAVFWIEARASSYGSGGPTKARPSGYGFVFT